MKLEVFVCDNCKARFEQGEGLHFQVWTDREYDASGNGYNDIYVPKDICDPCAIKILSKHYE